ncbi:hypothetical protein FGG08_003740 [Glutinoglossum americanum]|uniref:Dienelactone hydrolase domain-containing protein n=1 Tax=Glutinoglossum americanum TaxID=1670608 RepID=A0A9P8I1V0_9PEZI|nr:hypothetical protein FGG08_003740 [Glutinoglossum americanum]
MSEPSKACCTIPPIIPKDYHPKGTYTTIAGLKTYHTSPPSPTATILFIYDIFGYFPQTLQGADILASAGNFAVYMPDWFEDDPADISWYPPDTPEKGAKVKAFFAGKANPGATVARAGAWVEEVRSRAGADAGTWGVVGLCWGGKVVSLLSTPSYPFSFAATAHPAMVDPADATAISVPFMMLASKDEDPVAVSGFAENLKVEKSVETFGDQVHGWMGARGDLEDGRCRGEYERGYRSVTEFFLKFV